MGWFLALLSHLLPAGEAHEPTQTTPDDWNEIGDNARYTVLGRMYE